MTHTIAISHHAGGVGKTTTALNLGYSLAETGASVLLVDLDAQADLTLRLAPDGLPSDLPAALLQGHTPARHPFEWKDGTRVYLLPSNLETMAGVELQLASVQRREDRLAHVLAAFGAWDYILLDCPPALNLLTINALYAADSVLVPVQAQDKALRQLAPLQQTRQEVQTYRGGYEPWILGFLLTMTDHTRQAREADDALRAAYQDAVFETTIPRRTVAADDGRWRAPVAVFAPDSPVARAYANLAQEVITRAQYPTPAGAESHAAPGIDRA
jgi:chromosome partitioning protein